MSSKIQKTGVESPLRKRILKRNRVVWRIWVFDTSSFVTAEKDRVTTSVASMLVWGENEGICFRQLVFFFMKDYKKFTVSGEWVRGKKKKRNQRFEKWFRVYLSVPNYTFIFGHLECSFFLLSKKRYTEHLFAIK